MHRWSNTWKIFSWLGEFIFCTGRDSLWRVLRVQLPCLWMRSRSCGFPRCMSTFLFEFDQPQCTDDGPNLSDHRSYDIYSERGERCSLCAVLKIEEDGDPWILVLYWWISINPESKQIGWNASISLVSRCHFLAIVFPTRVFRNLDEQQYITLDPRKSPLILSAWQCRLSIASFVSMWTCENKPSQYRGKCVTNEMHVNYKWKNKTRKQLFFADE